MPERLAPKFEKEAVEEKDELESAHQALRLADILIRVLQDKVLRLEEQNRLDEMTGVHKKTAVPEVLEERRSKVEHAKTSVIMYVDGRRFKKINDTLGHEAGDVVIKAIANYLRTIARPEDIVTRFGGDEFGIVFVGADIGEIADRFKDQPLQFTTEYRGQEISVSLSAGIAEMNDAVSLEEAMRRADEAMYLSKNTDGSVVPYGVIEDEVHAPNEAL